MSNNDRSGRPIELNEDIYLDFEQKSKLIYLVDMFIQCRDTGEAASDALMAL